MSDETAAHIVAILDRAEQRAKAAIEALRCGCHPGDNTAIWSYQDGSAQVSIDANGHEAITGAGWGEPYLDPAIGHHIALWDPAGALDLISATRQILALAERVNEHRHSHAEGEAQAWLMDEVLALLAKAHRIPPESESA